MIRAYARMERALGSYGLARRPSETPLEYLARALTSLRVGRRSVERLSRAVRAREVQPARDRPLDEDRGARGARGAARRAGGSRRMSRWSRRRRLLAAAILAVVAIAIALALSGAAPRDRALRLPAAPGADRGRRASARASARTWPPTPRFERLIPARDEPEARVLQLEGLVGRLAGGNPNAFDLHQRIRPLVREIVAAQLARGARHRPRAATPSAPSSYVGPWTWQLIRPDLAAAARPLERARGRRASWTSWSTELERLCDASSASTRCGRSPTGSSTRSRRRSSASATRSSSCCSGCSPTATC